MNPQKIFLCDVGDDDSIAAQAEELRKLEVKLDFVAHSVAYAEDPNLLVHSVYSFGSVIRSVKDLLTPRASTITLTFPGSQLAYPGYNIMGVAKSAFEAEVRYLGRELGAWNKTRVNAISAGPVRTLASRGVKGFVLFRQSVRETNMLGEDTSQMDVACEALCLLSDLSLHVTGQIRYVDCGNSAVWPGNLPE
ncbi:MAG: SDR family oxidoreductase [Patescibacteria group bacterium]|nr:SDR family oxidoreductase [Patescibacteria group bacterium]